jgi:hypothetical protein
MSEAARYVFQALSSLAIPPLCAPGMGIDLEVEVLS